MKKNYVTCINRIVATLFLIFVSSSHAQDIHFTFDNAHNSNDGSFDYYEVDVMIQTINTTGTFKLGKGLLYFTYNTVAFGTNINANSAFEVTYPNPDYILGQYVDAAAASIYGVPTPNDNDSNRVAFAYSQTFSSSTFAADNVNDTPSKLFHIKIRYVDVNSDPMFCFDGGSAYDDQFETACGSSTAGPFDAADCGGYPGTVLVNDTFDCSGATLSNEDFKLLTGLSLYPNPTKRLLYIDGNIDDLTGVEVFSLSGQRVLKIEDNFSTIDLITLQSSIYFVKVSTQEASATFKIVKE